jgi:adenine-specific DNA-methyltransferase
MGTVNEKCQVFTPQNIVKDVLDRIGYISDLYGKKILENSCGDGSFLVEIVDRYIVDCLKKGYSQEKIVAGIQTDIYGVEVDKKHINTCIANLNLVIQRYNLKKVNWNILQADVLRTPLDIKYKYVVGNPPYITYSELDIDTRKYLKENFTVCTDGKPDYCYAFIESAIKSLDSDGKLAYIVPSNILKNNFAEKLRQFILPSLQEIYDYTTIKLFEDKLTSSIVLICDMMSTDESIKYHDIVKKTTFSIPKADLRGKWVISSIEGPTTETSILRFGDYFNASSSIATLLNEAFIIDEYDSFCNYIEVDGHRIERDILKPAVSPRSICYRKKELIIFPYHYDNGVLKRYTEHDIESLYPNAMKFLKTYKEKLLKRDADSNANWFEYGRSQALSHLNQEKLLLSTLVTGAPKVYSLGTDEIPYSGIYIIPKADLPLSSAKSLLQSSDFESYVKKIGINANGHSYRISSRDINDFMFNSDIVDRL